jgi:hypothetical protein
VKAHTKCGSGRSSSSSYSEWSPLLLTTSSWACPAGFHGQLGLSDYDNQAQPQLVRNVEKDRPVALYQGQPDDIQLAVVSAGSSHTASISRRLVEGLKQQWHCCMRVALRADC